VVGHQPETLGGLFPATQHIGAVPVLVATVASCSFAGPQHRQERFRVGKPVVVANDAQRRRRQPAVPGQFLTVGEGDHVVSRRVQNDRVRLYLFGLPPPLTGRAEQYQRRPACFQVHGNSAAPAGAHDHVGMTPVALGLGNPHGSLEVVVGQGRVQDFVAVAGQVRRLDAARHGLPTVEEEGLHGAALLPCKVVTRGFNGRVAWSTIDVEALHEIHRCPNERTILGDLPQDRPG
jgi:hypothetical protein